MYGKERVMILERIVCGIFALLWGTLIWTGAAFSANAPLSVKLAAKNIKISTFYNGTTMDVSGTLPEDADIVLTVSGPKKDVHLKKKGKVAGFLWMNKSDVSLENTPAVYMAYTPEGTSKDLLRPELGVGYKALVNDIRIIPESEDKAFIFGEYVKLMEEWGVYAIHKGAIKYQKTGNGEKQFSATLIIPSKMQAGAYHVNAIAIKNGIVISQVNKEFTLTLSGLPESIEALAFGSPLMFGIMAVLIAIATGLIIGFIFKGGGGAH